MIATHEIKGTKGPAIGYLITFGVVAVGLVYLLLILLTKLTITQKVSFSDVIIPCLIIAIVVALIFKFARDSSFILAYIVTAIILLPLALFYSHMSESLPMSQDAFERAVRVLITIYLLYVAVMIIMKISTRARLIMGNDGTLQFYRNNKLRHNFNIREYSARAECTYSGLSFHSSEKNNKVEIYINISCISYSQWKQIQEFVIRHTGKYVDNVEKQINEKTFLPDRWEERSKADVAFRDKIYKTITETNNWKDYPYLFDAIKTIAGYGHVESMYAIGMFYFGDKTIKKDYNEGPKLEGLKWLHSAAKHGSTKAAYELGEYYKTHWNRGYDPHTAAEYYRQAMKEAGYIGKQAKLGLDIANGLIDRDRRERIDSYAPAGGSSMTKSEIDRQKAFTALSYDLQSDVIAYNDYLTDEQKAKALGILAGLEINEQRELREQRKNASDD